MSIIKCKNCGKDVSDKTKKCIHCNHKIESILCKKCGAQTDLNKTRCNNCKKILHNKIPLLGKLWIIANIVIYGATLLEAIINIGVINYTIQNIIVILLILLTAVMNIMIVTSTKSIFYHLANIINFAAFTVTLSCDYDIYPSSLIIQFVYLIIYALVTCFFIRKCMKTPNKIFTLIYIPLVILLFSTYFIHSYKNPVQSIQLNERYSEYLKYAFGEDYKIKESDYYYWKNFKFYKDTSWNITYSNEFNVTKTFWFSNARLFEYENPEEVIDYLFANQIIQEYEYEINNYTYRNSVNKIEWMMEFLQLYSLENDDIVLVHKDITKLIDPEKGLTFKKIDFKSLDSDLYVLEMGMISENKTSNTENRIKEQVNELMNAYNMKNAFIRHGYETINDGETSPLYCVKNKVEFTCTSEYAETNTFIDKNNYITITKE